MKFCTKKMPFNAKVNDQFLQGINTYFARSLGPLISVLDCIFNFKASAASVDPKTLKIEKHELSLGKSKINLNEIRSQITNAIHLLSCGHLVMIFEEKIIDEKFFRQQNSLSDKRVKPC